MEDSGSQSIEYQEDLSLWHLFQNSIVFRHVCPYLTIYSILNLGATSKLFRSLVFGGDSGTFRHLDLSTAKGAGVNIDPIDRGGEVWRSQRIDESTTEEDFYCGPLRGIFSFFRRANVLATVQTLILDGQSAPAEVLREIICDEPFRVRILSVIKSKNLNMVKFQQVLRYAVRPSRAEGTPRLKGVYVFGTKGRPSLDITSKESMSSIVDAPGAQLGASLNRRSHRALQYSLDAETNPWYSSAGSILSAEHDLSSWAETIHACQGIIHFDAVLCRGPRHDRPDLHSEVSGSRWIGPKVASIVLEGCQICHTLPERPTSSAAAPSERLPLLSPVPKHSSSIKVAQRPPSPPDISSSGNQLLYARCFYCCHDRWCEGCGKFWCEDHYDLERFGNGTEDGPPKLKVYLGLCVEGCLVEELYQGSDGMWA